MPGPGVNVDLTGDGRTDARAFDTDGDGIIDALDFDGDGVIDARIVLTDAALGIDLGAGAGLPGAEESKLQGLERLDTSHPAPLAQAADDIWAFGLLLYKLLAAQDLFRSDAYDQLSDADGARVALWEKGGLTAEERASVLQAGMAAVVENRQTSLKCVVTSGCTAAEFPRGPRAA